MTEVINLAENIKSVQAVEQIVLEKVTGLRLTNSVQYECKHTVDLSAQCSIWVDSDDNWIIVGSEITGTPQVWCPSNFSVPTLRKVSGNTLVSDELVSVLKDKKDKGSYSMAIPYSSKFEVLRTKVLRGEVSILESSFTNESLKNLKLQINTFKGERGDSQEFDMLKALLVACTYLEYEWDSITQVSKDLITDLEDEILRLETTKVNYELIGSTLQELVKQGGLSNEQAVELIKGLNK